jgi:hypothetical protein
MGKSPKREHHRSSLGMQQDSHLTPCQFSGCSVTSLAKNPWSTCSQTLNPWPLFPAGSASRSILTQHCRRPPLIAQCSSKWKGFTYPGTALDTVDTTQILVDVEKMTSLPSFPNESMLSGPPLQNQLAQSTTRDELQTKAS